MENPAHRNSAKAELARMLCEVAGIFLILLPEIFACHRPRPGWLGLGTPRVPGLLVGGGVVGPGLVLTGGDKVPGLLVGGGVVGPGAGLPAGWLLPLLIEILYVVARLGE